MNLDKIFKMRYKYKDGFLYDSILPKIEHRTDPNALFIYDNAKIDDYVKFINKNAIEMVTIETLEGCINDLSFIVECKSVKYIKITRECDITPLMSMTQLKYLQTYSKNDIDVSNLINLEVLFVTTSQRVTGLDKIKQLRTLTIIGLEKSRKFYKSIINTTFYKVDTLFINNTCMSNLDILLHFPNLIFLSIDSNTYLENLAGLEFAEKSIKRLSISASPKLANLKEISNLNNLKYLETQYLGKIDNLSFLNSLKSLNSIKINKCSIYDNNLTPLISIDNVFVHPTKKKYYYYFDGCKNYISDSMFVRNKSETDYGDSEIESWRRYR